MMKKKLLLKKRLYWIGLISSVQCIKLLLINIEAQEFFKYQIRFWTVWINFVIHGHRFSCYQKYILQSFDNKFEIDQGVTFQVKDIYFVYILRHTYGI